MRSPQDHAPEDPSPGAPGSSSSDLETLISLLLDLQHTQSNQGSTTNGSTANGSTNGSSDGGSPPRDSISHSSNGSKAQPTVDQPLSSPPPTAKSSSSGLNGSSSPRMEPSKTAEPLSNGSDLEGLSLDQKIAKLTQKLAHLERQVYEPTELINPLIPLMTELLTLQGIGSGDAMLQSLIPIIDEAIHQRFQQDSQRMSAALAQILPEAISQQIRNSPTAIAKAIAPEIAIAIQEQLDLDQISMMQTLGPHMGQAIKTQIVVERDAMVDALYPVIGNTISKYMGEVVQSINEKVESTLSVQGISRKIRARVQGVSEAELIFRESIGFSVQAILLIHKASGLIIRDLQPRADFKLESDMLAGVLTAIRSFMSECVSPQEAASELHQINYETSKIILEVAGYCYLAVLVKGEPSKAFMGQIRAALAQIILKYDKAIATYDGDPTKISNSVDLLLAPLAQPEVQSKRAKVPGLVWLLGFVLIPLLFILYRSIIASQIETKTAEALDAVPELSVYRLIPKVQWGKLVLSGRVPNPQLRVQAEATASQVTAKHWPLDNRIIAIKVPANPVAMAGEIERLIWVFNQKSGTALTARHEYGTNAVTVAGIAANAKDITQVTQALNQIPGVESVISTVQIRPILESRLYFDQNSSQLQNSNLQDPNLQDPNLQGPNHRTTLNAIRQFLDQNPSIHLKIIGHSDQTGAKSTNQKLGLERARTVQSALVAEGITPTRFKVAGSGDRPPGVSPQQPLWLSRCVRFEVVIP